MMWFAGKFFTFFEWLFSWLQKKALKVTSSKNNDDILDSTVGFVGFFGMPGFGLFSNDDFYS